jgi:hypothetical protein
VSRGALRLSTLTIIVILCIRQNATDMRVLFRDHFIIKGITVASLNYIGGLLISFLIPLILDVFSFDIYNYRTRRIIVLHCIVFPNSITDLLLYKRRLTRNKKKF